MKRRIFLAILLVAPLSVLLLPKTVRLHKKRGWVLRADDVDVTDCQ